MSLPAVGETAGIAGGCGCPTVNVFNYPGPVPGNPLPLGLGGTGAALSAPALDSIFFYDVSAGTTAWLTLGAGLSIVGTVLEFTGTQAENLAFARVEGGTATDLDAMVTVGKADRTLRWVVTDAGVTSLWGLFTGTAVTNVAAGILRPLDYSVTNTRNWIRIA